MCEPSIPFSRRDVKSIQKNKGWVSRPAPKIAQTLVRANTSFVNVADRSKDSTLYRFDVRILPGFWHPGQLERVAIQMISKNVNTT